MALIGSGEKISAVDDPVAGEIAKPAVPPALTTATASRNVSTLSPKVVLSAVELTTSVANIRRVSNSSHKGRRQ